METEILVGYRTGADGSTITQRGGRTGEGIVGFAHSEYAEPSSRGNIFQVANAVTGVAPGTALSTTPPMALWNPPASTVNLVIISTGMGYVSGTLGPGSVLYAQVPSQTTVPATGTELTPVCTKLGFPRGQARAFTGSTLVSAPTILRAAWTIGAFVGGANTIVPAMDFVKGVYTVPPGGVFAIQGLAGAGTTPLVVFSITWEETPI